MLNTGGYVVALMISCVYTIFWAYTPQLSRTLFEQDDFQVFVGSILKASPIVIFSLLAFKEKSFIAKLTSLALALSAVGDYLLDIELIQTSNSGSNLYFLSGLGFFLCAHLVYALSFAQYTLEHSRIRICFFSLLPIISIVLHYHSIPSFQRPAVFFYSCVIAFMTYIVTIAKLGKRRMRALWGAFLFIISDSILAADRFGPFVIPQAKFLVMITYYSAQALLTSVFLQREPLGSKTD
jgi:uncharacterized membrane protein YhhN